VAVLVRSADEAGRALTHLALMQYLQSRIARFKLPRTLLWLESLPKSALGKVQKPVLQAMLIGTNP
jgi:fatty-acyl-CoA synthase